MRLFITGASGFIGAAACRVAIQRGHQVLGMLRRPEATNPKVAQPAGMLQEAI